ncbi:membrane protein [Mycobacterium phage Eaglepride]|nr:membrane protein [Mycobacterium phage Eaglepride]
MRLSPVRLAAAGTVFVGGLAFSLSFTALSELAANNGVAHGWMVPLVIDGGVVVATTATVALRSQWYPWTLLILGTLVSVAGNVAHAGPHGVIAMVIAAIPPLWLLASTHLTVLLYRGSRESRSESKSEALFTRGFAENPLAA